MAIYEYNCKCGTVYEMMDLKSNPKAQIRCPVCKTKNIAVTGGRPAVVLKASGCGWAKHGYSRQYSIADGPENPNGDRHKRSGKTVVPVRGGLSIEPDKDKSKKKKPSIKIMK